MTEPQILAFLDYVSETAFDDAKKKRAIINAFVNLVYLYDDHYSLILNTGKKPVSKENVPLEEIEAALNSKNRFPMVRPCHHLRHQGLELTKTI